MAILYNLLDSFSSIEVLAFDTHALALKELLNLLLSREVRSESAV